MLMISSGAAERSPDKAGKDPEGAKAINVSASANIAREAAARDIFLIYISTDYIFPGRPGDAPYEIDATPKPTNLYGETKLNGERAVLQEFTNARKEGSAVSLRVPILYGHSIMPCEGAVNILMELVWEAQTPGKQIKMDHWAQRYPTNTQDVGRVCQGM